MILTNRHVRNLGHTCQESKHLLGFLFSKHEVGSSHVKSLTLPFFQNQTHGTVRCFELKMTWIIIYFSFSQEDIKAEKGDMKCSGSSRWLVAEPGLGLIFLETQVTSLSIRPHCSPTHPPTHPSNRPCKSSLTIIQKAFPPKQSFSN